MNRDDLMNALSGLDPKYIDEAAFELHGNTVSFANAKKARARKNLLIALPTAAAAFILIGVMLLVPTLRKMSTSESASVSSDAAAPAPAESAMEAPSESAAEAPSVAEEAVSDAEPAYEAEEAAEPVGAYEEAAEAPEAAGEAAKSAEEAAEAPAAAEESEAAMAPETTLGLKHATWYDGRLVVRTREEVPSDIDKAGYSVTGTDEDGRTIVFAKGLLGDVLLKEDPLTLDLSDLGLEAGTYTLKIGEEEIEFTI